MNGGTSCYGDGPVRVLERGTRSHSTVEVDGQNSSEVWSGFRVARRAFPIDLKIDDSLLEDKDSLQILLISCMNDVIKQSPELMKMFTDATVNSMSQQSSSFEFANNLMQDQMNKPKGPPPPAPVETKTQVPPQRPGMMFTDKPGNRPDINAGRGTMFREDGLDVNRAGIHLNETAPPIRTGRSEMKGPQSGDIDNILSGLKTRNVNIQKPPTNETTNNDSMISASSLRDIQNTNIPHTSSKKRNKSDKNIISLDI